MRFLITSSCLLLLCVGLTVASPAVTAQVETIRIHVPEGYDEVTFDRSRVTREELLHWLTISPIISQNNYYLVPEDPISCDATDPVDIPCGRGRIRYVGANAKHTQDRIRERLGRLDARQFPSEFELIVSWLRTVQRYGLWRNQKQIDYFEQHDIGSLEMPYEPLGLSTKTACSAEIKHIRESLNPSQTVEIVWHDCKTALGKRPAKEWADIRKKPGTLLSRLMVFTSA